MTAAAAHASAQVAAQAAVPAVLPAPPPAAHRLAELYVDRRAIARNVRHFAHATGTPVMAVVKADGFGHGDVAEIALANGATWVGVATIPEAMRLRERGIAAPMLSWLNPVDADWEDAIGAGIDVAVTSFEQLYAVASAAERAGGTARLHLHLDIGMSREGAPAESWSALCVAAAALETAGRVRVVGIMGHLSSAETPASRQNDVERLRFVNGVRVAHRRGLTPSELHLAATAGALHRPDSRFTLSRVGAGLYGIDPAGIAALTPALTLTAPVAHLRRVAANTGIGYGHDHTTARATTLAVLPIGYGDGLPRAAQEHAQVAIRGRRYPIVGRISMDQVVVDVGNDAVELGDIAVLMGPGTRHEPTMRDWAEWSGTIEHEIVTRLGVRNSRVLRSYDERWAR
ncbi:alanine racemase [Leucobacter albus]|uniref:Alanine racemase n=1 Tax=Leucobacter albus TaxID=272210 RepID=A0ABW3TQJ2_9MICO